MTRCHLPLLFEDLDGKNGAGKAQRKGDEQTEFPIQTADRGQADHAQQSDGEAKGSHRNQHVKGSAGPHLRTGQIL